MIVCAKCFKIVEEAPVQDALKEGKGYIHTCGRIFFYMKGNNRWDTKQS